VGWRGGSGCGGRRKPIPGGLAAASMPRTPPQPDPPCLRQISAICRDGMACSWWVSTTLLLVGVDLGRHVDPRHAWILFNPNSKYSKYSLSIEIRPRMAWIYQTPGNCQRWGGVGLRGVRGMGPRHASGGLGRMPNPGLAVCAGQRTRASRGQAPKDGFTASPLSDTAPPSHRMPAVAVASEVAGQRPALPRRQVQGAALPKNPYNGSGACAGSMRPSPRVIFLNSARLTDT
jgi:hypothetical protein